MECAGNCSIARRLLVSAAFNHFSVGCLAKQTGANLAYRNCQWQATADIGCRISVTIKRLKVCFGVTPAFIFPEINNFGYAQ